MQQNNSTFSINSGHFSNRIDSDIVQLVKTLSIEHQISVNEAKEMARTIVQNKLNELLTPDQKSGISNISKTTIDIIKASKEDQVCTKPVKNYASTVYELLKTMGLI